jgi:hypothetical protein
LTKAKQKQNMPALCSGSGMSSLFTGTAASVPQHSLTEKAFMLQDETMKAVKQYKIFLRFAPNTESRYLVLWYTM